MTTLLALDGASVSRRALQLIQGDRRAGRAVTVLTAGSEPSGQIGTAGLEATSLAAWLRRAGALALDDWPGVWELAGAIERELGLGGAHVLGGVDLWQACRIDFALYAVSSWVRAINLAVALLDDFRPTRLVVENDGTLFNRALLAAAAARNLPAVALAAHRRGSLRHELWSAAAAARAAWGRGGARSGEGSRGAVALVNHALRNLEALRPVAACLKERGTRLQYVMVADDAVCGRLPGADGQLRLDRLPLRARVMPLASLARRIQSDARRRAEAARHRLTYRGVDVGAAASADLPREAAGLLISAALWVERAHAWFDGAPRQLLLTTNERAVIGRAVCLAARRRGIPVLLMQFGLMAAHPAIWSAPVIADAVAAEGEESAAVLRSAGGGARVVICGQPSHDALLALARTVDAARARAELGVPEGSRMVLYASHAFGEEAGGLGRAAEPDRRALEYELEAVYREVSRLPDVTLVVKPHPNESMPMHRRILAERTDRRIVLLEKTATIRTALICCDLLITHHSTTGMEALVLGKPLAIVNLTGQPDAYPYVAEGVADGAYGVEDIAPTVQRLLIAKPEPELERVRGDFLRRRAAGADGRAAERVAELVAELLGIRKA